MELTFSLGDPVAAFDDSATGESARASVVELKSGRHLPADAVVLDLGVRPKVGLAKSAGPEIGMRGGIRVDEHLQTAAPPSGLDRAAGLCRRRSRLCRYHRHLGHGNANRPDDVVEQSSTLFRRLMRRRLASPHETKKSYVRKRERVDLLPKNQCAV